jgi:exopolysaccharide biosynthesis WecB/TagA/CpsF family protein
MTEPGALTLLGQLAVARLDVEGAARAIAHRDPAAPFAFVAPVNAQVLLMAQRTETGLRPALDAAWMLLNDSRVLARLHRLVRGETVPVAAGSDLAVELLSSVATEADPIAIVGGGPDLVPALLRQFRLGPVFQHDPPMGYAKSPTAWNEAIEFIENTPARITFIATGAPRSEQLAAAVAQRGRATGTAVMVGSGLLFAAGLTRRAPEWMQRCDIEWLHRAWTEPRRLGRRYVADVIPLLRLAWRARRT